MKNYCLDKNCCKYFILNYVVINDNLIINKADGTVDCLPYNIENEKVVLKVMKEQVLGSKKFFYLLNKKYEIFLKLFLDEILLVILLIIAQGSIPIIYLFSEIIIFSILIGLTAGKLFNYKKTRDDIKKNFLFIRNELELNPIIRNNYCGLDKVDGNLRDKVLLKEGKNFSFTLNTIDRLKYKELLSVYRDIDSTSQNDKCFTKKLSRKRKKDKF